MAGPLLVLFTTVLLTKVSAIDYGECRNINNTTTEVINGTCFYLFKEISYWVQAYGICRENGLDLAYLQGQNIFTLFRSDPIEGRFWIYGGKVTPCKTIIVDPSQNKTVESKTRCTNNKEGFLCESIVGWGKTTETPKHADEVVSNTQTAVIITLACFVAIFLISLIIVIIVCKRPVIQRNILYDVSSTADGREAVYEEPRFDIQKNAKYDVAGSAASAPLVYYEPKRTYSVKSTMSYEEPVTQKDKFKRIRNIWKFRLKGPEQVQRENDKEVEHRLTKDQIQVIYQNEEEKVKGDEYLPMDSKTSQEPTNAGTDAEVYEPILHGNE